MSSQPQQPAIKVLDQPGLAVGIVQDGKLVWSKGYGKLDLAKSDPVTPNTIFFIASMSKAFTAAAIGLLVDDGKIGFDDPVRNYLPRLRDDVLGGALGVGVMMSCSLPVRPACTSTR